MTQYATLTLPFEQTDIASDAAGGGKEGYTFYFDSRDTVLATPVQRHLIVC
jgi:hypothetical protein